MRWRDAYVETADEVEQELSTGLHNAFERASPMSRSLAREQFTGVLQGLAVSALAGYWIER